MRTLHSICFPSNSSLAKFLIILTYCKAISVMFVFGQDLEFRRLGLKEGLSQNSILCIHQDQTGFMWFGTEDGLNRFDGKEFVSFWHEPNDTNSIRSNRISTIGEDELGYLWVGSFDGYLHQFDPKTQHFSTISLRETTGIKQLLIQKLIVTNSDSIWIASSHGLFLFESGQKTLQSVRSGNIMALILDEKSILWAGTSQGDFFSIGLTPYQDIKDYTHPLLTRKTSILSLLPSKQNGIWLGTTKGLFHWDIQASSLTKWKDQEVACMAYDDQNRLWLGAYTGGLIWDSIQDKEIKFSHNICNPGSISHNHVSALYKDRANSIWVGTYTGINYFNGDKIIFQRYVHADCRDIENRIRSIFIEEDNTLFVGTEQNGFFYKNLEGDSEWIYSRDIMGDSSPLAIWSILGDQKSKVWIGMENRLYSFEKSSKRFKGLVENSSFLKKIKACSEGMLPLAIEEDAFGRLLIASQKCGLFIWDPRSDETWQYGYDHVQGTKDFMIQSLNRDKENTFWLGTVDHGLAKVVFENGDPGQADFSWLPIQTDTTTGLSHTFINSVYPTDTALWIGTYGGGLNKYHRIRKDFAHYTMKDGLPNDVIYAILPDDHDNIWMSTNRGISRFDPEGQQFANFDVHDGLQGNEFNSRGGFKHPKTGELFFGGGNGLNSFFPERIERVKERNSGPIVFTDFLLADSSAKIGSGDAPKVHIGYVNKIELSHNDNTFTLMFATLDYTNPGKIKYQYKLEGLDENWRQIGNRTFVPFNNLPCGKYIFRVKGTNSLGKWSSKESTIKIQIRYPWYRHPLAWIAYFLIAMIVLATIVRLQQNKAKRKARLKKEEEKQKAKLKEEKEKVRQAQEFNQKQIDLFNGIAHEFRTPLTLILGPVEELFGKLKNELTYYPSLNTIRVNGTRLLHLVNQILDIARSEAEVNGVEYLPGELVSFVKEIQALFEVAAQQKRIELYFQGNTDFLYTEFDPDMITKIVYNLLSNALKHTPVGGRIGIILKKIPSADSPLNVDSILISVTDNGDGIPSGEIKYIFDRFYTGKKEVEKRGRLSSGIGLALCNELVKKLEGKIEVNSIEGQSSAFMVFLPLKPLAEKWNKRNPLRKNPKLAKTLKPELLIQAEDDKPQATKPTIRPKILIVEDELEVLRYLIYTLEADYDIYTATNGLEGLECAKDENINLILTDILMPEMDGITFTKEIKSKIETSHVPIIMLTAKHGKSSRLEGFETGADDYIEKPFDPNELKIRINNLLQSRAKLKQRYSKLLFSEIFQVEVNSPDRAFFEKLGKVLSANLGNPGFGVEKFSEELNMSRQTLSRKTKGLLDSSPGALIKKYRMEKAKEMLLSDSSYSIQDVVDEVGYSEKSNFSSSFKKYFGMSPSEIRKRNQK